MSVHEQFADDLALYALGALTGEESTSLEKHLGECSRCRRELEQLRGDAALLGISTSGSKPPGRSRERLMSAIAKEPRRVQTPLRRKSLWWKSLEWAGAAALIVMVLLLARQNTDLQRHVSELQSNSMKRDQQLLEARQLLATLTSPDAVQFTLVAGKTPPQP